MHDSRHGYLHKGCSKVVHRTAVVIPEWPTKPASRYEKIIGVTRSTNQIDHTWNKTRSEFFRTTWASMSRSPTAKIMMQVILMSAPTVLLIYRCDNDMMIPKNLRAIIVSRDPYNHKNDSTVWASSLSCLYLGDHLGSLFRCPRTFFFQRYSLPLSVLRLKGYAVSYIRYNILRIEIKKTKKG